MGTVEPMGDLSLPVPNEVAPTQLWHSLQPSSIRIVVLHMRLDWFADLFGRETSCATTEVVIGAHVLVPTDNFSDEPSHLRKKA